MIRMCLLILTFFVALTSFAQKSSSWLFDTLIYRISQKYEFVKSDQNGKVLFGNPDFGLTIHCDTLLRYDSIEFAPSLNVEKIETTDKNCYIPGNGIYEHILFEIGSSKIALSCFDKYIYNIEIGNEFGKTIAQIPMKITDSAGGAIRINTLFINTFSNKAKLHGSQFLWYNKQMFSYNPLAEQLRRRNIPSTFRRFFFYDRFYAFQFFYDRPQTIKGFYREYRGCGFSSHEIAGLRIPETLYNGNVVRAFYKTKNHNKIMAFYDSGKDFISSNKKAK